MHQQSGRCLDGSVSQGIRLNTCNTGAYQSWTQVGNALRHSQSGMCLDGSISAGVRLNTCNQSVHQNWL
ncbi:hypothetical protein CRV15_28260 (plasmid) [Streptomyces clavuligerus]|uniref:RICIN domain-containing protein n=1 Tax=Streptomyces clavuligerus TaxID=1901 RepID=UPI000998A981|nr:ricin-type beta-trefoil lectin domain protein [Streptomyces clavuligerus]QCS09554.1 hypothetical protein CRV15_28260 [Streptomyces clavuligerus]QPJ98393.1 hypothetical protein GE265_36050 [Streptomyces clavuligerus]WDN57576.1 ricin-type beta-trefoil lectin domain protein [Streptomyces clavuligerus]